MLISLLLLYVSISQSFNRALQPKSRPGHSFNPLFLVISSQFLTLSNWFASFLSASSHLLLGLPQIISLQKLHSSFYSLACIICTCSVHCCLLNPIIILQLDTLNSHFYFVAVHYWHTENHSIG